MSETAEILDPLDQVFKDHDPNYTPEPLEATEVDEPEVEETPTPEGESEDPAPESTETPVDVEYPEEEVDTAEGEVSDIEKEIADLEKDEFTLDKKDDDEDSWKPEDWNDKTKFPAIRKENAEKTQKIKQLEAREAEIIKERVDMEQSLNEATERLKELEQNSNSNIDPDGFRNDPEFKKLYSEVDSQRVESQGEIETLLGKTPSILTDISQFTNAVYDFKDVSGNPQEVKDYIRSKTIEVMGLQDVAEIHQGDDGAFSESDFTEELSPLQLTNYVNVARELTKALRKGSSNIDNLTDIQKNYQGNAQSFQRKEQLTSYQENSKRLSDSLSSSGILDETIMQDDPYSFETHVSKSLINSDSSDRVEQAKKALLEFNLGAKPLSDEHLKYYEDQGRKPEEVQKLLAEKAQSRKESLNNKFLYFLTHEQELKQAWEAQAKQKEQEGKKKANAEKISSAESAPTSRSKSEGKWIDPLDELGARHGVKF